LLVGVGSYVDVTPIVFVGILAFFLEGAEAWFLVSRTGEKLNRDSAELYADLAFTAAWSASPLFVLVPKLQLPQIFAPNLMMEMVITFAYFALAVVSLWIALMPLDRYLAKKKGFDATMRSAESLLAKADSLISGRREALQAIDKLRAEAQELEADLQRAFSLREVAEAVPEAVLSGKSLSESSLSVSVPRREMRSKAVVVGLGSVGSRLASMAKRYLTLLGYDLSTSLRVVTLSEEAQESSDCHVRYELQGRELLDAAPWLSYDGVPPPGPQRARGAAAYSAYSARLMQCIKFSSSSLGLKDLSGCPVLLVTSMGDEIGSGSFLQVSLDLRSAGAIPVVIGILPGAGAPRSERSSSFAALQELLFLLERSPERSPRSVFFLSGSKGDVQLSRVIAKYIQTMGSLPDGLQGLEARQEDGLQRIGALEFQEVCLPASLVSWYRICSASLEDAKASAQGLEGRLEELRSRVNSLSAIEADVRASYVGTSAGPAETKVQGLRGALEGILAGKYYAAWKTAAANSIGKLDSAMSLVDGPENTGNLVQVLEALSDESGLLTKLRSDLEGLQGLLIQTRKELLTPAPALGRVYLPVQEQALESGELQPPSVSALQSGLASHLDKWCGRALDAAYELLGSPLALGASEEEFTKRYLASEYGHEEGVIRGPKLTSASIIAVGPPGSSSILDSAFLASQVRGLSTGAPQVAVVEEQTMKFSLLVQAELSGLYVWRFKHDMPPVVSDIVSIEEAARERPPAGAEFFKRALFLDRPSFFKDLSGSSLPRNVVEMRAALEEFWIKRHAFTPYLNTWGIYDLAVVKVRLSRLALELARVRKGADELLRASSLRSVRPDQDARELRARLLEAMAGLREVLPWYDEVSFAVKGLLPSESFSAVQAYDEVAQDLADLSASLSSLELEFTAHASAVAKLIQSPGDRAPGDHFTLERAFAQYLEMKEALMPFASEVRKRLNRAHPLAREAGMACFLFRESSQGHSEGEGPSDLFCGASLGVSTKTLTVVLVP